MKEQACNCVCVCIMFCTAGDLFLCSYLKCVLVKSVHRNVWVMSYCSFYFSLLFHSAQIPRCTRRLAGGEWSSVCIWSIWEQWPLRRSFKHDAKVGEVAWPGIASDLTCLRGTVFMGDLFLNQSFVIAWPPSPLFLPIICLPHFLSTFP